MEDKYCPDCGKKSLELIGQCEADSNTTKKSYACREPGCEIKGNIVCIYEFEP